MLIKWLERKVATPAGIAWVRKFLLWHD